MNFLTASKNTHRITVGLLLVCLIAVMLGMVSVAQGMIFMPAVTAGDLTVYDDTLTNEWVDWSWGAVTNLENSYPAHTGSASIATTINSTQWGGLYLHTDAALNSSGYLGVRFWIHGGVTGSQQIDFKVIDENDNDWTAAVPIVPVANTWTQVTVLFSQVSNPTTVAGLVWQDGTGDLQPTFYVDDIVLIGDSGLTYTPSPTVLTGVGPALSVDVAAERQPISPYIYGMNFADEDLAAELGLPVGRWGGNSTSRYNWQTDVHNTGSDWYFENIPGNNAYDPSLPNNSTTDLTVEQNLRTDTETILTMPLIGWTPKSNPEADSHPFDCGFKVSVYGSQEAVDPWDLDCGNGNQGGTQITWNDPNDTSIAIGPPFVTSWINHLTARYGTAANGGVMFYNLDNEPMLWNSTHRDVFPDPTSYDVIRDRTWNYAAAIKAVDPSAQTLGPVVWGWCAYFHSALDGCSPGSDYQNHGDTYFTPWYLQQMAAYEQTHGIRILDYLDLHIYPQVSGVFSDDLGNADVQAARLRSTRQFWDPTYVHEGWINQPVYLIPRMQQWIADNYPDTKTAITEYNWGAHGYLNGALAQADILGIFGREGLDLATLWGAPDINQPAAYAFRMFLNYDGLGSGFGDTNVRAVSDDQEQLAIYAAQREYDGAVTLMIINKTDQALTSSVSMKRFTPYPSAQVFLYSAANLNAIVRKNDLPVTVNGFTAVFPANSITLVILFPIDVPDLSPSNKAVEPPFADYRDTLTYTLQIINQGLSFPDNVFLTDTLPASLGYIPGSLNATSGSVDDSNAPILYWTGALTPTQRVDITYAVSVTSQLPQVITNSAVITAPGLEPLNRSAQIVVNGQQLYLPLIER